jgi:hypothetical protein
MAVWASLLIAALKLTVSTQEQSNSYRRKRGNAKCEAVGLCMEGSKARRSGSLLCTGACSVEAAAAARCSVTRRKGGGGTEQSAAGAV